ncbi:MAG: hypothetical protein WC829_03110 [Hyphomicrobium sp.]|jgi:hypothetical protein
MKKRYEWKELSADGLLKDVRTRYGFGEYGTLSGGETDEEAVQTLAEARSSKMVGSGDYVLLTVYTIAWDE